MKSFVFIAFGLTILLYAAVRMPATTATQPPPWLRFLFSVGISWAAIQPMINDSNRFAVLMAGFLIGLFGQWFVLFSWTWARHGWRAARHVSLV